jgi:tetratricopeptide (TPR) repeat protein
MVETTAAIVQKGITSGKDAATLVAEDVLKGWESWEGSYVSKDEWVYSLYQALTATRHRKTLYEPIYYALRDRGPYAAIEEYHRLKRDKGTEYRFVENDLAFMADKLFRHERFPAAIAFLNLCLEEYPKGLYSYYYHYLIGRSHMALGNREQAIASLRETVKLRPDLERPKELLADLEAE